MNNGFYACRPCAEELKAEGRLKSVYLLKKNRLVKFVADEDLFTDVKRLDKNGW